MTVDGIKFVNDKRKSGYGMSCQDIGKESKTVSYEKITDCDVIEPAGTACCCCIPNVLSEVRVDTAAGLELRLVGLKHPHEFKKAVWDMKRKPAHSAGA